MDIELDRIEQLRNLVKLIDEINSEPYAYFEKDKIVFNALDLGRSCNIWLDIRASFFKKFIINEPFVTLFSVSDTKKILKKINKNKSVKLGISDNKIFFKVVGERRDTDLYLTLIHPNDSSTDEVDAEGIKNLMDYMDSSFTIGITELVETINTAENFSDEVNMIIQNGEVEFYIDYSALGEFHDRYHIASAIGNSDTKYSVFFLKKLASLAGFSKNVKIYASTNAPLVAEIDNIDYLIRVCISPRIDDDD